MNTTIIDFHTHVFPDDLAPKVIEKLIHDAPTGKNYTDGTAEGLGRSLDENNITRAVVLPIATKKEQVMTINAFQISLDSTLFIPFGAIHPDMDGFDTVISSFTAKGIRGIKLHPEYQNFYMDAPVYFPVYEALSAAGIAIVFHAGKDPGPFTSDHALPSGFKTLRGNFPGLKIVAAHMGGWQLWEESYRELCGESFYFDTSAIYGLIDRELFMRMVKKHGCDRILFGSDSPWFDQGEAFRWIDALSLSDMEKELIFHANAERFLGF
jgi:uncharacterized protein